MSVRATLVLALVLTAACSAISSDEFARARAGFHADRSGDMVLLPRTGAPTTGGALVSFGAHVDGIAPSLPLWRVGDLAARELGLLPLVDAPTERYPVVDLFDPASAHAIVVVPGLTLSELETPRLWALAHSAGAAISTLDAGPLPSSGLGDLVTALTARTPSEHGIVGSRWPQPDSELTTDVIDAFSRLDGDSSKPLRGSLADALKQSTGGESVVIAVSADDGVNAAMSQTNGGRCQRVVKSTSWNDEACPGVGLAFVSSLRHGRGALAAFDDDLAMLAALPRAIQADNELVALLADGTPDLISIAVLSYGELVAKHGVESVAARAARAALDGPLADTLEALGALVPARRVSRQLLLLSATQMSTTEPPPEVATALVAALGETAEPLRALPFVRLTSKAAPSVARHCRAAAAAVAPLHYDVFCRTHATPARVHTRDLAATNGTKFYDDSASSEYQTAFWTTVILVLVFYTVVYSVCYMHMPNDPLLRPEERSDLIRAQ